MCFIRCLSTTTLGLEDFIFSLQENLKRRRRTHGDTTLECFFFEFVFQQHALISHEPILITRIDRRLLLRQAFFFFGAFFFLSFTRASMPSRICWT